MASAGFFIVGSPFSNPPHQGEGVRDWAARAVARPFDVQLLVDVGVAPFDFPLDGKPATLHLPLDGGGREGVV